MKYDVPVYMSIVKHRNSVVNAVSTATWRIADLDKTLGSDAAMHVRYMVWLNLHGLPIYDAFTSES